MVQFVINHLLSYSLLESLLFLFFGHADGSRVEFPTEYHLAVEKDLCDTSIGDRDGEHDDFGLEVAHVASD